VVTNHFSKNRQESRHYFPRQLPLKSAKLELREEEDPEILEWAADHNRILLTHDRATVPNYAWERVDAKLEMPGIFVIPDRMSIGQAIDEILLSDACSNPEEWKNRVLYFPL
jgi:hypothetical protein